MNRNYIFSFPGAATVYCLRHRVVFTKSSPCLNKTPFLCTARCQLELLANTIATSTFFLAVSLVDLMPSKSSTPSLPTRRMSWSSCRKRSIAAKPTLWSSLIQILPTFNSNYWSTVTLVSRVHRILSWETISSSEFSQHRLLDRETSKASNPTGTASSLETATQIQTACSLSCQTMICRHQVATIQIWFTKGEALLWTGVKPLRRSRVLIAWCQIIISSWRSCTLGAAAVTHPVTAGVNLAFMRLRLEFAKTVSCVTVSAAGIISVLLFVISLFCYLVYVNRSYTTL